MKSQLPGSLSAVHAGTILDSIADGVFTVDMNMRITFFNRAASRITGVPADQAVGRRCFHVFHAGICDKSCALKSSFRTGRDIVNRQVSVLRSDGKNIPISISTAVLRDDADSMVGGVESFRDLSPLETLRKEIHRTYTIADIVSKNHHILALFDILPHIADAECPVVLQGPSGSGKELFARAIHTLSRRKAGPFVAVNCGALPDTLLESELFGYQEGAFTGATKDKPGRFALARGGTMFLDEVDSLTPSMQVKLLRVLQEREYHPLGATAPQHADVRVIAASKEDLEALVASGRFRDDLLFRLNVVRLALPPLDERRDDIPLLVHHFIAKFNRLMDRSITGVTDDVMHALMRYPFPGNIRELENIIEHAFVMCRTDQIGLEDIPTGACTGGTHTASRPPLKEVERRAILDAIRRCHGNKVAAARSLHLHRTSLWRKMKKYGLA